jgi:glycosyltransferase involved in cell wall biosynthesis
MKILVNGWYAGVAANGSGQYITHLLATLPSAAAGTGEPLDLVVLLPRPAAGGERTAEAWPGVTVRHIPLLPGPAPLAKLWWEQVTVPWQARQMGADRIWSPYWAAPVWQPCPVVVTVHDVIGLLLPEYRGALWQQIYTKLVSATARQAAAILTVSHASKQDIVAQLGVAPERVHVVYHGPNQEAAVPDNAVMAQVRARYGLPERYFLYLGGFDKRKNLPALLRAYALYRQQGGDPMVQLVIAGKIPPTGGILADPRPLAAELGLASQIHCCGWVAEADKPALYAGAVAFVFPSLYEGFGMMITAAQQAGTAVVTSAEK